MVQSHSDKKRLRWKLAVVESLIRGNDNCVRAVNLRTANGRTNRPITKLYPLEVSAEMEPKVSEEESVENKDRLPQPTPPPPPRMSEHSINIVDTSYYVMFER